MSQSPADTAARRTNPREDEGASLSSLQLAESLGITRQMTETYAIGGYRYTNVADAIAQARRMAKLESELL